MSSLGVQRSTVPSGEDKEMKSYMDQMDEELARTSIGESFEKVNMFLSASVMFIVLGHLPFTVFSRLNAGGVYLKLGLVNPAYIRTRCLFGARSLFIKCIFQYWRFIEPRTKF